jgi:hypothetical protein
MVGLCVMMEHRYESGEHEETPDAFASLVAD